MAPKVLRNLFSHHHKQQSSPLQNQHTISNSQIVDTISTAEFIISKCTTSKMQNGTFSDSIFYNSNYGHLFLRSAADLHRTMITLSSSESIASPSARSAVLLRAHSLLESAMHRLEIELGLLLSSHHCHLHPSGRTSSSSDDEDIDDADVVGKIREVVNAMINAGYGMECVRVYKSIRRSAVEDAINEMGFRSPAHFHKVDMVALEPKIRSWLSAAPSAFRTVFSGERDLCDQVFADSESVAVRDSCFADIVGPVAISFLAFPESVASKTKRSWENLFQFLELYDGMADLWPEIEFIFSSEVDAAVRTQALNSLSKLAEAARYSLENFENIVQKDSSKTPVPCGGVHPLTRFAMNSLVNLADYEVTLIDLYADIPFNAPARMPESFFDASMTTAPSIPSSPSSSGSFSVSPIAPRIAWLVLVLLCKLNTKAELYHSVSISYLFLANNLNYIVRKVRESHLSGILGDGWASRHANKANEYASTYVRLAWGNVVAKFPSIDDGIEHGTEEAALRMTEFNSTFEEAYRVAVEEDAIAVDEKMREEIRVAVAEMVVGPYTSFYQKWRPVLRCVVVDRAAPVVRFSPEDVRNRIFGLFDGPAGFGSSTLSHRSSFGSRQSRLSRWSNLGSKNSRLSRSDDSSVEPELPRRSNASSDGSRLSRRSDEFS